MRTTEKITIRATKHERYSWVVRWPGPGGKRAAKLFADETAALKWAKERMAELGDVGESFGSISEEERGAVMFWRAFAGSLTSKPPAMLSVLQEYAARLRVQRSSVTVADALDKFLAQQEVDGASMRHLASLRSRVGRLKSDYGDSLVASIDHSSFTAWLNGLRATRADKTGCKLSLCTRENLKTSSRTFFEYCRRNSWIETNPVPIERKKRTREHRLAHNKAPSILLPPQVENFMHAVKAHAPKVLAFWAVKFFAGIRDAEADRMTWEMIDQPGKKIHMPASITKTADQRSITISANLSEWLKITGVKTGRIAPSTQARQYAYKRVLKNLATVNPATKEPVPFVFPSNAARHCFGTYHLYAYRDAGETALQLGHKGNPAMLHEHYKNPTAEKHAADFWEIYPAPQPGKLKREPSKISNVIPIAQITAASTARKAPRQSNTR